MGFSLPPPPGGQPLPELPGAVLDCFTGHADLRMLPMVALSRAYGKAMRSAASGREKGCPQGLLKLRKALAAMLAQTKGLPVSAASLLIGDGIQGTLDLLARALIVPGDRVAVEDPGGSPHREVFRRAGAELVPIPVDGGGLDLEALGAALGRGGLKALLTTPQCQYPTTVPLAPERRRPLLALAREHRFAIIELDQDGDFHYEGAPILPLASEEPQGTVIYVSALSKVLFPNLPLAFLHAPEPVIAHLVRWRQAVETGRDPLLELAVAELLEDGEIQRLLHRLRRTCHQRRDHLAAELRRCLGYALRFTPPRCGMSFWAEAAPDLDVESWAAKALALGVAVRTGREFTFPGSRLNCLRFGFGALREAELDEAVARLARACPDRPGESAI
jgi:GntR family transcriptional regulator/MocR family aminotransferase